jgi:hypothetical protein
LFDDPARVLENRTPDLDESSGIAMSLNLSSAMRAIGLKFGVMVAIVCTFLFFAPNYEWSERSSDTPYGADFLQEWVGAKLIVGGQAGNLYEMETFVARQHDPNWVGFSWESDSYFPPVYPPPHYMLFTPFVMLPYRWAAIAWLVCLVAVSFLSAWLIEQCVNHSLTSQPADSHPPASESNNTTSYLWIGLLLFPSLLFSITLGQKSVLWLLMICFTMRLLQVQKSFASGVVFGLLSVKPTLFFLLPLVMLRNRQWRFLAGATTSVCILWGSVACLVPLDTWLGFARGLRTVGSYAENSGYRMDWSCNLMTLATCLPAGWSNMYKWGMCLPLTLYLLYSAIEDKTYRMDSPEKWMMVFATTLAISPHTYHYDMCILLLPILWLMAKDLRQGAAYFAMLAVGITVGPDILFYFNIPILPILLVGIVCELRLRSLVPSEGKNLDSVSKLGEAGQS